VADSSSSRHISQVGLSVNPIFKRCPFRWQCPVSSPTTHLNWSLFNFNRSFVLLAEGQDISPFASLSPVCLYVATVARQQLGKNVVEATNTHATIDELLGASFFLCGPRRIKESRRLVLPRTSC
jgi:hypothetical protein